MNPDLKLIAVHDTLSQRIDRLAQEKPKQEIVVGPAGEPGKDGVNGKDGRDGKDGKVGKDGKDGKNGKDGKDGDDGVGVKHVAVDMDGHLTVTLTDGNEIDAGDLTLFLKPGNTIMTHSVSGSSKDMDIGTNGLTSRFVAAETITAGECCHLDSSGQMVLSDATDATKASSLLSLATEDLTTGQRGTFLIKGSYALSGFAAGATLFITTTGGTLSATSPVATGNINRVAGYALSTTEVFFDPDKTWMEIA